MKKEVLTGAEIDDIIKPDTRQVKKRKTSPEKVKVEKQTLPEIPTTAQPKTGSPEDGNNKA